MNHSDAEGVLSMIERAARLGIVRLAEVDALDRTGGNVGALVKSLRADPEGRHRRRVAAVLESRLQGAEGKGRLYSLIPSAEGEPAPLRFRTQTATAIFSMDDGPVLSPERAKRRYLRFARVNYWRERLELVPRGDNFFGLRDLDDPAWNPSVMVEALPDGRLVVWSRRRAE